MRRKSLVTAAVLVLLAAGALIFRPGEASAEKSCHEVKVVGLKHMVLCSSDVVFAYEYRAYAIEVCSKGGADCAALFWKDASMIPSSIPMTHAQLDAMVAVWHQKGLAIYTCIHHLCAK